MKILVIGMNPSKKGRVGNKENASVSKLNKWMTNVGVHFFSFSNVHESTEHLPLSKVDYKRLCTITSGYDKILALGGYASSALNKIEVSHFKLPHPSPRNRLLNDKSYESNILKQCRKYLK